MTASAKSKRLKKLPALTPAYRRKFVYSEEDGDRDRLLELCGPLKGHDKNLIAVLWPLYMLGRDKLRELRGTHDELQAALKCKMSRRTFITTLTTLKKAGFIHVDVQCVKGTAQRFTRIGVREELYVMLIGSRTKLIGFQTKYPAEALSVAVRIAQADEDELSLGYLNGHSDQQRDAIRQILVMARDDGLSYGHFSVLRIMHEKFLELKEATGWNPRFPFYHALAGGKQRYWPNVLKVFKNGGIRLVTAWAYCAYGGVPNLFGNNHPVYLTGDEHRVIQDFIEGECGHERGSLGMDMNELGKGSVLRDVYLKIYEEVQLGPTPNLRNYLHDLFSW